MGPLLSLLRIVNLDLLQRGLILSRYLLPLIQKLSLNLSNLLSLCLRQLLLILLQWLLLGGIFLRKGRFLGRNRGGLQI